MRLSHVGGAFVSLLHAVFLSFYTDLFLRQHIPAVGHGFANVEEGTVGSDSRATLWYFVLGQLLYAFWNGVKEVAFERRCGNVYSYSVTRVQMWRLSCCGPIWAMAFALLWFPVSASLLHPAVRFTLMMAVYDKLLGLCRTALETLSRGELQPGDLGAEVYDVLGGVAVALACYLSELESTDGDAFSAFRWFTTICAIAAALALYTCGRQQLKTEETVWVEGTPESLQDLKLFAQQTLNRCSMKAAVLLWTLQEYNDVFATCFFNVFLTMCSSTVSLPVRALMLLLAYVTPHMVIAAAVPFLKAIGKKRLVSVLLLLRASVGALFIAVALCDRALVFHGDVKTSSRFVILLLFSNRLLTDTVSHVQSLVLSDLVDEDTVIFARLHRMTAPTQQLLTIVSKPFQSLSLALTCLLLVHMCQDNATRLEGAAWLAGGTAFFTSLLALWGWGLYYNLDGYHLQFVLMAVRKRADGDVPVV
ncbi:transmembrane protein 180 [Trypanosoma grayi]|uniref:transmembrane protein 180 n=1 Tax=Trypanosoma grayi TaxID=71804 RepID=UPI0004F41BF8|nr:transmembrane protein 180 [Trypanosoma grayi]KEG15247.1 transmembrane protein 180 [Trypanosoma grayi]